MPNQAPQDWQPGHQLLGDYEVVKVLGEGGMGKVYLVRSLYSGSQFAVKRAKGMSEADRKAFLAELQTWIDLPDHPNLVPCRFFRTMGNEVLIFAEYVEGGSLREWIDTKKLYEGGRWFAVDRMLDVAIQLAWGLHCVHELGTVHQDVKPGNVLMGMGGKPGVQGVKPQLTDYGLARARAAAGEGFLTDSQRRILVSSVRGTPAYWSPEQAQGLPLTHKTDIWSWGVSVLELFTGEVTWMSGRGAAEVLEQYLEEVGHHDAIPAMPADMADLLRRCFQQDPTERLANLAEAVEHLQKIYRDSVGLRYGRTFAVIERDVLPSTCITERRHTRGTMWTDPKIWLEKALRVAGRYPATAEAISERRGVTRRGELVAELAVYDEAKRLYEGLILEGRKELELDLATLCMEKAMIHSTAADEQGALEEYDQVIAIRERFVGLDGRSEHANDLSTTYTRKADSVSNLGDKRGALVLYDQAIAIQEMLVNREGRREFASDLSRTYTRKADALNDLGDRHGAVAIYDRVIAIREMLVNREGRRELSNDLAMTYMNKGIALIHLGNNIEAAALCDQAIAIRERLVNQEGRRELSNYLATTYSRKALAVSALGDKRGAVALCDQAIAIWERFVVQEGRREWADELALAYSSKADHVSNLGDKRGAVVLYDQALAIRERLVNQEGRRELAEKLAMTYMNKATAVRNLGDYREAAALNDQAIAIRERLVNQEGRSDLANDLAMSYLNKAGVLSDLGDKRGAVVLYDQAIAIREKLVNEDGHRELANYLAGSYMGKASTLGALGDHSGAMVLYDQAIAILERLVNQEGRSELACELAMIYLSKANWGCNLGDNYGAVALYNQAIAIHERLVNQEGRSELVGDLALMRGCRGEALIRMGDRANGLQDNLSAQSILKTEIGRTNRADLQRFLTFFQQQFTKHSTQSSVSPSQQTD